MPNPIDVVEALLFASDTPLEAERIREVLDLEHAAAARELVEELIARYAAEPRGLAIVEVGGGYRMVTRPATEEIPLEDLSVPGLERAMRRLIEAQQRARPREVEPKPPSVLERMTEILSLLRDTWSLLFSSMTGGERTRSEVVVTLLAVLELCRQGKIRTQQTELFGDIVIERQTESAAQAVAPPAEGQAPAVASQPPAVP